MQKKLQAIVLAAGKSSRFKTGKTKLLEKICGQPMILYSTKLLTNMNIETTLIVGYQKESVKKIITDYHKNTLTFIEQKEQLGTGDALLCSRQQWKTDHILIMNGDVPLITQQIIEELYKKHIESNAAITFVTSHIADMTNRSYGRVIKTGNHIKIVEACELDEDNADQCCINAGIYLIKKDFLKTVTIEKNKSTKEFFITDLVELACKQKQTVSTISAPFDRIRGINTFEELWAVEHLKRAELIKYWMNQGVRFSVAQNVHLDLDVTIGAGSYIGCGVHLLNGTKIGTNVKIHEFASLQNTIVGDNTHIYAFSIIENANIGKNNHIGPFVHMRDNVTSGDQTTIGNFVEIKNSTIGAHSKAKHLAYLGDAQVGDNVNIGAGTITCNYDGIKKHKTVIKDDTFIGSNNTLVAPITVEKNAYTAAGSVITDDVPENALAIARPRQINKDGYAKKIKNKTNKTKPEPKKNDPSTSKQSFSFMGAIKTHNDLPIEE